MNDQASPVEAGQKPTGLKRIWLAFFYSMEGFRAAWKGEAAFRQELVLALVMLPLGFMLGRNAIEYIALTGTVLLVLIVELLNSAIEATVDRIGPEKHELSKNAKDMGSAAVLVSLLLVMLTWGLVFADRFILSPPSN
ncbi:MAG TPA: diacylglycerol kinase [Woeseiaceae bacterium]|nr:diacylglycerol kinase [Woeseiaceae bacterium]